MKKIHNSRHAIDLLIAGETFEYTEPGNSMTPLIQSNEPVTIEPVTDLKTLKKGDIVLCKVHGRCFTHKINAIDKSQLRFQIANNHGHVNGWASTIYGKVIAISGIPRK